MGLWPRILSYGETPVELIESAGRSHSVWQWWMPPCLPEASGRSDTVRAFTLQPLKIRVGSDPIKPADASLMLS